MRYFILGIVVVLFAVSVVPLPSYGRNRVQEDVGIEITSDNGSTFRWFPHRDCWKGETRIIKNYLEAKRGETYGIVIRNNTPERIGIVIAVDGRNIISGKKSNLKHHESMYLLDGYECSRYGGWRTDSDRVHQFYFTDLADSYAMKTFSDSSSLGVIAVAVYREKDHPEILYDQGAMDYNRAAPSIEGFSKGKEAEGDKQAGTGFGEEQYSPVRRASFDPEHIPVQKTFIKYEWREILCRKGIIDCRQEPRNRLWDEDDYAPYPPGYPQY